MMTNDDPSVFEDRFCKDCKYYRVNPRYPNSPKLAFCMHATSIKSQHKSEVEKATTHYLITGEHMQMTAEDIQEVVMSVRTRWGAEYNDYCGFDGKYWEKRENQLMAIPQPTALERGKHTAHRLFKSLLPKKE